MPSAISVPSTSKSSSLNVRNFIICPAPTVSVLPTGTVTSPVNRYTTSGSFQNPFPTSVPLSSTKALEPLFVTVTPLIAGFEAKSMLIAATLLF